MNIQLNDKQTFELYRQVYLTEVSAKLDRIAERFVPHHGEDEEIFLQSLRLMWKECVTSLTWEDLDNVMFVTHRMNLEEWVKYFDDTHPAITPPTKIGLPRQP